MNVFLINSAPGVGKSTLLKNLQKIIKSNFAFIDGDDLGRINPTKLSREWLNLIQDNIVSCIDNYFNYGIDNTIVSFVFPTQERVERITKLLNNEKFKIYHIVLVCDKHILLKRVNIRNSQKIINVDDISKYDSMIRKLKCDYIIDTTNMDEKELCYETYKIIKKLEDIHD